MKFGKQLLLRMQPGYDYMDYKLLKQTVKSCVDKTDDQELVTRLKDTFRQQLDKVEAFYSEKEQQGERKKSELVAQWSQRMSAEDAAVWSSELSALASYLETLGDFVILNQLGFSKILKKCEKKVPSLEMNTLFQDKLAKAKFIASTKRNQLLQWAREEMIRTRPEAHSEKPIAAVASTLQQPEIPTYEKLDLDIFPVGSISRLWIVLAHDGLAQPIKVPVIVAKGVRVGPVLGITACLHGNELNGIPLIHRLFREIDCSQLSGTVVAVPVANTPGFLQAKRGYHENSDLNRLMPGKKDGTSAQLYAYNLMERIVSRFTYLIDMHTASVGRINSLYVRANMRNAEEAKMAILQNPQIIVHNTSPDGSLRSAAVDRKIPAITIEVGDPQRFHKRFINFALLGVENIMCSLQMVLRQPEQADFEPVICTQSQWLFTKSGGVLTVLPDINSWVKEGQVIAYIHSIFGDLVEEYFAPSDGIVVGKSVNPVCTSGDRILHLGVVTTEFAKIQQDGHL